MSTLLAESPLFFALGAAVFGLLVGSFLNVVIHRLPREDAPGVAEGRSKCPRCGHAIRWYENVPVVSWIVLRGRCSECAQAISPRYPLVELATGGIFLGVFELFRERFQPEAFPWGYLVVVWALLAVLLAASMIDFDFQILPDVLTKPMMPLGIASSAVFPQLHQDHSLMRSFRPGEYGFLHGALDAALGVLAGLLLVGGLRAVASAFAGREAMGFGDVKLMGGLGAFVGAAGVPLILLLGAFAGSLMGLANVLRLLAFRAARMLRRGASRQLLRWDIAWIAGRVIPFGPALSLGGAVVLLFRSELTHFLFETWPAWLRGSWTASAAEWVL